MKSIHLIANSVRHVVIILKVMINKSLYKEKLIKACSVDELVKKGIKYIQESGGRIWTTSGLALQSNNVTYVLDNSFNRVHTLREPVSMKYFARELFAYFVGSLKVDEGLSNTRE